MNTKSEKQLLLEQIASEAYNVGYSASLHFATFDIASKVPTMVTVASFAVGILGLVYPALADKLPSAILLIIGICMLYVRDYESRLKDYERTGIQLNNLYKRLQDLCNHVRVVTDGDAAQLDSARRQLVDIRGQAANLNVSPQIFGASWKAHHRFFWVIDTSWFREYRQPPFTWRDMAPFSFFFVVALAFAVGIVAAVKFFAAHVCI